MLLDPEPRSCTTYLTPPNFFPDFLFSLLIYSYRDIQKNCPHALVFHRALTESKADLTAVSELLSTNLDNVDVILFPRTTTTLLDWVAFITGPPDTPFENARFQLKITVPTSYPHSPPVVLFVTPICHPNVHFKVRRRHPSLMLLFPLLPYPGSFLST